VVVRKIGNSGAIIWLRTSWSSDTTLLTRGHVSA
jgi:hypothetical protein